MLGNPFIVRDLVRIKKKIFLYSDKFKHDFYKKITFYNFRKSKLNYPLVLQLPITNKCNLDCVMCNIQSKKSEKELSIEEFSKLFSDRIFKKIISVGINGGEPFIIDICERIDVLIEQLPKLKYIYIITNGTLKSQIQKKLPIIKKNCERKKIQLIVSVSIDGVSAVHDTVRCMTGCFNKSLDTIRMIRDNKAMYCDVFNVICTISKLNVYDLNNIEAFAKEERLNITYNIATEHERLNNKVKYNSYSLFTDPEAKMIAQEFFFRKFVESKSMMYYAIFKYLLSNGTHRPSSCSYLRQGITITPDGQMCYCATHSKKIGDATKGNIYKLYFENQKYNYEIENQFCERCSHYMGEDLHNYDYHDYIKACVDPWFSYKL